RTSPGNLNHSCPVLAAFFPSMLLALLLMAASSSFPTRSSDRARCAATQISTTFRTSPSEIGGTQYLYSQEAIQSAGLIAHTTSAAPARTNGTAKNLRANDPGE